MIQNEEWCGRRCSFFCLIMSTLSCSQPPFQTLSVILTVLKLNCKNSFGKQWRRARFLFSLDKTVLRIRILDPVVLYPLDPGWNFSGSRIKPLFWWNFLKFSSESLICYLYETGLLLKLTPETISSKKKVCLVLLPRFYMGLRIQDKTSRIRNTGTKLSVQVRRLG
jgi:hypothetical protein